jgi:hypothetical protein
MFRIDKVITSTPLANSFKSASEQSSRLNEALLITQRSGQFLVVVEPKFFAGLLEAHEARSRMWGEGEVKSLE